MRFPVITFALLAAVGAATPAFSLGSESCATTTPHGMFDVAFTGTVADADDAASLNAAPWRDVFAAPDPAPAPEVVSLVPDDGRRGRARAGAHTAAPRGPVEQGL